MIYKDFKGNNISCMGMGNMRLPQIGEGFRAPVDYAKAQELVDHAIANGVNYFDTAYDYHGGDSEKFLGGALSKYPRDSYYLATKFFILASTDYKAVFEEQLKRLKTDYIDYYLIHGIFDHTFQQYLDCGCIEYFEEQKAKGRIKHFGFSSHANVENLTTFVNRRDWDFCMIQLNYFDWFYGETKKFYEIIAERNIPVIAMGPVRGGRLGALAPDAEAMLKAAHPDRNTAEWAFKWLKRLPGLQLTLSGISTMDNIKENLSYFQNGEALSDADTELLKKACDAFRIEVQIPCTDCRYCCSPCPANISIEKILKVYNRYKIDGPWALRDLENVESEGKPADCTECGVCNGHCPQNIDILSIMREIKEMMKQFAR